MPNEDPPIVHPVEAVDFLAGLIDAGQWEYSREFAEAVARLNAACARHVPDKETPDPVDGEPAAAVHT